MSDNPSSTSPDTGTESSLDDDEKRVDVVADIRRLMAERNRAAERARGGGARRSQWA